VHAERVKFAAEEEARAALERSGAVFGEGADETPAVVLYAPADWNRFLSEHPSTIGEEAAAALKEKAVDPVPVVPAGVRGGAMVNGVPAQLAAVLPKPEELKSAFWSAVLSAKSAASQLEARARAASAKLDKTLEVSHKLDEASKRTRAAADDIDGKYRVREKVAAAAAAGRERADEAAASAKHADSVYGVSRRMSELSASVTNAGGRAAREVDENLRLSERARGATNSALQSEQIGPAVRSAMSRLDGFWSGAESDASPTSRRAPGSDGKRKKDYRPSGVEQSLEPLEFSGTIGEEEEQGATGGEDQSTTAVGSSSNLSEGTETLQ
jgi:hypothetical protein